MATTTWIRARPAAITAVGALAARTLVRGGGRSRLRTELLVPVDRHQSSERVPLAGRPGHGHRTWSYGPSTCLTHRPPTYGYGVSARQWSGNPAYGGEQDNDPRATTDPASGSSWPGLVQAAESQAFTS